MSKVYRAFLAAVSVVFQAQDPLASTPLETIAMARIPEAHVSVSTYTRNRNLTVSDAKELGR